MPLLIMTPQDNQILRKLLSGNQRFVNGKSEHPHQDVRRLTQVAAVQKPIAVIVSCSDSRVPPEIIFDTGLGDLFVIRTAGHVVDDVVLGSIEFAVANLGVSLVLVLGHERCGAVQAALKSENPTGHVLALVTAIRTAIAVESNGEADPVENAVHAEVQYAVHQISRSKPILLEAVQSRKISVHGARYDLDTGEVTVIL